MFLLNQTHTDGMKTMRKMLSAVLCAALLLWYGTPSVQMLLNGGVLAADSAAIGLTLGTDGAAAVRGSADERLGSVMGQTVTVRLLGAVPLRSVRTEGERMELMTSGRAIGIRMDTQGVQIVGLGGVRTDHGIVHPAEDAGLLPGDAVLSVNGIAPKSNEDFARLCDSTEPLTLLCLRDGTYFSVTVTPVRDEDGVLRIGTWVRDSTSGIGTLSFYDPVTLRYAALGHGVSDVDTGVLFGNGGGWIYPASITGVQYASGGEAGELIGAFSMEDDAAIGSLTQNTPFGIAGTLYAQGEDTLLPLAEPEEARLGEATLWCVTEGTTVRAYRVRVIRLGVHASAETDGMMIQVVDRELLDRTGGIVQGMSGSPIVQDGKLIGVVTHVLLNDSTRGYCIYAKQMAEKLLASD